MGPRNWMLSKNTAVFDALDQHATIAVGAARSSVPSCARRRTSRCAFGESMPRSKLPTRSRTNFLRDSTAPS
jgi:hypothetical protein